MTIWDEIPHVREGEKTPEHMTPLGRFVALYVPITLIVICLALTWGISLAARGCLR
ncbi:MAG: hypothetical protein KGL39_20455 [Patescibacteria group bacterium]|nr:hypothetical protein [Patescibacteria group bacterium]